MTAICDGRNLPKRFLKVNALTRMGEGFLPFTRKAAAGRGNLAHFR